MFIPVDQTLVPTEHIVKVDHKDYRIVDAQERVIGSPLRRKDVEELVKHKRNSRIVY